MRICIVTTVFPRRMGDGEGAFIWQHALGMKKLGHEIKIIAMHSPGTLRHELFDGVPVVRVPYWWPERAQRLRRVGGGIPINVRGSKLAKLQLGTLFAALATQVIGFGRQSDLIHANFTIAAGASLLGKPVHRRPVVITVHGSDIFQGPSYPLGGAFTKAVLQNSDAVVAVSGALRERAVAIGASTSRCTVVPNSVDTEFFAVARPGWSARDDHIMFVGSLIKRKGIDYLLQAFAMIETALPETMLLIVGEGPELDALKLLAVELGIAARVRFTGMLDRVSVRKFMQGARVLVLPSTEEGQGVVMLEALACGTPVIGTAVGGIPEVIEPTVGRLIPPRDVAALGDALLDLCNDDVRWNEMSIHARRLIEEVYSPAVVARQYDAIYSSTLNHAN